MNRIKDLRIANQMKQSDLAKMLNCSPTTISNYEVGYRDLDSETIRRLCDIFDCTADYLLCRSTNAKAVISDEDSELLQAFHSAPPSVAAAILTLLQPYRKENEADQAI